MNKTVVWFIIGISCLYFVFPGYSFGMIGRIIRNQELAAQQGKGVRPEIRDRVQEFQLRLEGLLGFTPSELAEIDSFDLSQVDLKFQQELTPEQVRQVNQIYYVYVQEGFRLKGHSQESIEKEELKDPMETFDIDNYLRSRALTLAAVWKGRVIGLYSSTPMRRVDPGEKWYAKGQGIFVYERFQGRQVGKLIALYLFKYLESVGYEQLRIATFSRAKGAQGLKGWLSSFGGASEGWKDPEHEESSGLNLDLPEFVEEVDERYKSDPANRPLKHLTGSYERSFYVIKRENNQFVSFGITQVEQGREEKRFTVTAPDGAEVASFIITGAGLKIDIKENVGLEDELKKQQQIYQAVPSQLLITGLSQLFAQNQEASRFIIEVNHSEIQWVLENRFQLPVKENRVSLSVEQITDLITKQKKLIRETAMDETIKFPFESLDDTGFTKMLLLRSA